MTWLVTTGLTNAALAVLLSGLAYGIGRWAKRPALTHVLWVLVLIKLLTPPVFEVPIGWRIDPAVFGESRVAVAPAAVHVVSPAVAIPIAASAAPVNLAPLAPPAASLPVPAAAAAAVPLPAATTVSTLTMIAGLVPSPANCLRVAVAVWIAGSLWMTLLFAVRTWRFRKYLRLAARPDAELNERLAELARKARLYSRPSVLAVESTISPMLFGLGRKALLIFPAALNRQLEPAARDTLLLHELAHYARGDHWVRLIEMLAQIVFWWHPVVWWARKELDACEEECCDAWVVERHAGVPRLYAEALLATIDFLCDGPQPLPPVACGLGDVPFLKARLTQIIRGRLAAQLSPAAKAGVFLAAMFILPIFPTLFGAAAVASPVSVLSSNTPASGLDESPSPVTVDIVEAQSSTQLPAVAPAKTSDVSFISPTLAALASWTPARPAARHYGTAVSRDGRYKLEIREGYQATLLQTPVANQTPKSLKLGPPMVKCASFSPNGDSVVTGHDDSKARLYDCHTGGQSPLGEASAPIRSIMYSPDGSRVAAGCADGSVVVWDVDTREPSSILRAQSMPANCVRWSHDGKNLAISLGDSLEAPEQAMLVICSADQGIVQKQFELSSRAGAIEWLDGDEALLIAEYDGRATILRESDGQVLSQVSRPERMSRADLKDAVSAAQWSPDCQKLEELLITRAAP